MSEVRDVGETGPPHNHRRSATTCRAPAVAWSPSLCTPTALITPAPRAELTAPPFAVSETGWGEFEILVAIHLRDPAQEPVSITKRLKLYPNADAMVVGKPVVDEVYDELVFNALPAEPAARAALLQGPTADAPPYPYGEYFGSFSAEEDLARLAAARQYVHDRKLELQDRLLRAQVEADREKEEVKLLGVV
jgi:hypothetical protein